MNCNSNLYKY